MSALLFTDSFDLDLLARSGRHDLTLVDHNHLAQHQSSLAESVRMIIDHHKDDHLFDHLQKEDRIIEAVGSASTLIARRAMHLDSLDKDLARLLLPAILVDTLNMNPALGRGTMSDGASIGLILTALADDDGNQSDVRNVQISLILLTPVFSSPSDPLPRSL